MDYCRLCKKESKLCNSHILPEFFYAPLYNGIHKALVVSATDRNRHIGKGIREYLLCQECETKLSRYEGYAATIIQRIPQFQQHPSGLFVYSEGVNYQQFKLFQLSILWRASVSRTPMFANVQLGKHEEIIRCMLNNDNPGRFYEYGCFILMIPNPTKVDKILWSPMQEKLFGHNGYSLMTGNLQWYFIVSSHLVEKSNRILFLQETGVLPIWLAPWSEHEVLANISKALRSRRIKQ